jgi:hypothetical protein
VAKLLTIIILIIGLLVSIGIYRLPAGWFTPSAHAALEDSIGPVDLTVPEVQMRWGGWRHPLGIKVKQVIIEKHDIGLRLEIPNLLFSLKMFSLLRGRAEIGQCYFESAQIFSQDQLVGVLRARVKMRGKKVYFQSDFTKLSATLLSHLILKEKVLPSGAFPIDGKLILEGSRKVGLTNLDLECKSEGGVLIIPGIYPEPVTFDHAQIHLYGTGQTLTLKKLDLKRGQAHLAIHGSLHSPIPWKSLYEDGGKLDLSLTGQGGEILVDDLKFLWPQGLSSKPRHWVIHQLSKGIANRIMTQMEGVVHMAPGCVIKQFTVPRIDGEIDASGVMVDYFGKLPPVTGVTGKCHFTRQKFMINAVGLANGIQVKSADIVIHDLHLKDQTIDINLDLEGPLRNALEIINADPLYLAKKLDLEPPRIFGQATTKVQLSFPLETDVPLEQVTVAAQSQISQGKILYDGKLNGKPINLDQGTFSLDVSKKSLEMKGKASLQETEMQVQWKENFEHSHIPFRRQFTLKGILDLNKLKKFGLDATDYLAGQAPIHVQYTADQNGKCAIEGLVDLTSSVMVSPVLLWQKEEGEPAHLKLNIGKNSPKDAFLLENATLIAPKLSLVVVGQESSEGEHFETQNLQIGESHLNASIVRDKSGVIEATLRGKVLDLSHILDDSTPEPLIKPSLQQDSSNESEIKVKLQLDEVRLGKDNAIHQVSGDMLYHRSTLMKANLLGKAPHNNESISLSMTPLSHDRQQFTLKSGDGGHLLEMLGADYDLEGGQLVIEGVKTEKSSTLNTSHPKSSAKSWEIAGTMSIEDFAINRAPLLAKLLSAASLQGIVNFFSGRGIHFHTGTADFSLNEASLKLKKVRLISPSLGLLLEGAIDREHHKVHFSGELIPLYVVNTVLAQMPLLGGWISGGKSDGIFMTQFTLTGDRKDPDLAINPITTVTPGLVRELFAAHEEKP